MGIEFSRSYKASDGKCYSTLEEAQIAEVKSILEATEKALTHGETYAKAVVLNRALILDVLTTTDSSRPKARAVNGGRKPRKPKSNSALPDYTETQRPDGVQTAA